MNIKGMGNAYEACVVLYLAQGSYNTGALGLACLHYIVTTHATSLNWLKLVYGPFGQSKMHFTLDFCR